MKGIREQVKGKVSDDETKAERGTSSSISRFRYLRLLSQNLDHPSSVTLRR